MPTERSGQPDIGRAREFTARMAAADDPSLLVLKGHLAVQRLLERIVAVHLPRGDSLDGIDLGFYHLLQLAQAAVPRAIDPGEGVWEALVALNDLRNTVVHEHVPGRAEEAVYAYLSVWPPPDADSGRPNSNPPRDLRRSIALLGGVVEGTLELVRERAGREKGRIPDRDCSPNPR